MKVKKVHEVLATAAAILEHVKLLINAFHFQNKHLEIKKFPSLNH